MLVVGNAGMAGRKEFLLGNVPNRISHNARCTVIIVNTAGDGQVVSRAPQPDLDAGAHQRGRGGGVHPAAHGARRPHRRRVRQSTG